MALRDLDVILKLRLPLLGPHWERYVRHRLNQGYTQSYLSTMMTHHLDFHRYLTRREIAGVSHITPSLLESYLRSKAVRFKRTHGRSPWPGYLLSIHTILQNFLVYTFKREGKRFFPVKPSRKTILSDSLLRKYEQFCRHHKGIAPATRNSHRIVLLDLRSFLDRLGLKCIKSVTLSHLDAFLLEQASHRGPRGLYSVVSSLRCFFRWLHLREDIDVDIAPGIISPSRFRSDLRPKYLPWRKIQMFLSSFDRRRLTGKRDYAIVLLLACHGLRAREVAKLRVCDIDLARHALFLRHRKDGGAVQLPISPQTEEALRDYLSVRPSRSIPEVFLTKSAPIKPLVKSLKSMVWVHLRRFFGKLPFPQGAYLLRHSFAKAMLDKGAGLPEIGALLGHRSLKSTLIYTRIATEDMREVADNYANFL